MEDCSVTFAFGRRYGLVGRNGSGKTRYFFMYIIMYIFIYIFMYF